MVIIIIIIIKHWPKLYRWHSDHAATHAFLTHTAHPPSFRIPLGHFTLNWWSPRTQGISITLGIIHCKLEGDTQLTILSRFGEGNLWFAIKNREHRYINLSMYARKINHTHTETQPPTQTHPHTDSNMPQQINASLCLVFPSSSEAGKYKQEQQQSLCNLFLLQM